MTEAGVPTAISAMIEEEPVWHALHIDYHRNVIESVGRMAISDGGVLFYERNVPGNSVSDLPLLKKADPQVITHAQALERREGLDASWASRNILHGLTLRLWNLGRLKQYGNAVGGTFAVDTGADSDLPVYTLWVEASGALALRIDNPKIKEGTEFIQWHEYALRRRSSKCSHRVQPATGKPYTNIVINGEYIVSNIQKNLTAITNRVARAYEVSHD